MYCSIHYVLSVMLLYSTQKVELFGNTFASPNSFGTWTVCSILLGKNSKGFYVIVQVKWNGV